MDVDIAVADEDFDDFAAAWRDWLADITPTVSAVPLPGMPGSLYALTPACERMDVIVERVSATSTSPLTRRLVVFDRDDLTAAVPEQPTRRRTETSCVTTSRRCSVRRRTS